MSLYLLYCILFDVKPLSQRGNYIVADWDIDKYSIIVLFMHVGGTGKLVGWIPDGRWNEWKAAWIDWDRYGRNTGLNVIRSKELSHSLPICRPFVQN